MSSSISPHWTTNHYYDSHKGIVYTSGSSKSSNNYSTSSSNNTYYYNSPSYVFNPVRVGNGYNVSGIGNL